MVCLRNISVDTLHKGDTKDNNNKEGIHHTKARLKQLLKKQHSNAWPVYYKYGELICDEDIFLWLSRGDLTVETESEIRAAQDQAL